MAYTIPVRWPASSRDLAVAASLMSYWGNGALLSSSDATGPCHSGRRLIGGVLALCLILTLSACTDLQVHVREQALANDRITIEKVSALAVESAIFGAFFEGVAWAACDHAMDNHRDDDENDGRR